jgi:uncharacterized RDD family membrane protein YckC
MAAPDMIDHDECRSEGYADATASANVPAWLWVLTAISYGWLLLNLILLIIPSRKPLHDRVARSIVVRTRS